MALDLQKAGSDVVEVGVRVSTELEGYRLNDQVNFVAVEFESSS